MDDFFSTENVSHVLVHAGDCTTYLCGEMQIAQFFYQNVTVGTDCENVQLEFDMIFVLIFKI